MGRSLLETVMGAVVLGVALFFAFFVYDQRTVSTADGYAVNAAFSDVSGVSPGSEVRLGGIKVGTVTSMHLENETYRPMLGMHVRNNVKLPMDTSAAIVSESLLGGKYVKLEPGADDRMLEAGGEIRYTQSSVNLEEMIGKFVFSGGGVDDAEGAVSANESASDKSDEANPNSSFLDD